MPEQQHSMMHLKQAAMRDKHNSASMWDWHHTVDPP